MKIKKVDDKSMTIHIKEKATIHFYNPKGIKAKAGSSRSIVQSSKTADIKIIPRRASTRQKRNQYLHKSKRQQPPHCREARRFSGRGLCMKYVVKVNEVRRKEGSSIKGFATVVFGDSFKITNIAILENKSKGELFVSMPRYRTNERKALWGNSFSI